MIKECFGKSAAEQKKVILRLKEVLRAKKRDYLLGKIVSNALGEMKKRAKFEIVFAREQPAEVSAKLEKILGGRMENGEDADVRIDPSIVGGFIAATDKYLIDASIRGQLEQLGKNF